MSTVGYYKGQKSSKDDVIGAKINEVVDAVTALQAVTLASTHWVTVVHAPPTTFVTPLMFDDTGTTGGLYAWTGSAYQKVGLATT